jgi:competence ComEA-like helix-hairpin-helix protein
MSGAPIKLVREEAARVIALSIVAIALVGLSALRSVPAGPPAPPMPTCTDGAHRSRDDGRVRCGAGEGDPLTTSEQMLAGTKMDVNQASAADLEIIPGIGPKLAARIVEDRAANGPFASIPDVERVSGVGPKLRGVIARFARTR